MAPSTIIVGGGAIGLGIAWRAAELGCDVTLIDPSIGGGASTVAAGMLAPVTEVHYGEEPLLTLSLASSRLYPGWIERLSAAAEIDPGYRTFGTVVVARDADDNAALGDLYRHQLDLGLDVRRLRSRECREIEPGLSPSTRGGILVQGDHQVDTAALVAALSNAAERTGVELRRDRVAGVLVEGERVRGVTLQDGTDLYAEQVVVAAGAWSGEIAGIPTDLLPVRPVKGQVLNLEAHTEPCPISRTVRGLEVYLVPRGDGRLIVGATMEEKAWDDSVTVGAVHDLLRHAFEVVPGVTEMKFVGARVGFRPGTPDNAPLLGETGIDGLVAATGHGRNGILLTPISAESIAHLLATGETMPEIESFSPRRFARSQGVT